MDRVIFTIQFPIADMRPYVPGAVRLAAPEFLAPLPGQDFVRAFGTLVSRPSGGLAPWAGENVYGRAAGAIRFDGGLERSEFATYFDPLTCAYRRLHSDGGTVVRVEIGLWGRPRSSSNLDPDGEALADFLGIPVRVRDGRDGWHASLLAASGKPLARHYLKSTLPQHGGNSVTAQPWWVASRSPMVFIEDTVAGAMPVPPAAQALDVPQEAGFDLHHWHVQHEGTPLSVWLLRHSDLASPSDLRLLRMHLLRVHAERQCLASVLRAASSHQFPAQHDRDMSDQFQAYLRDKARMLMKETSYGFPQSEILRLAFEAEDLVTDSERASLLNLLGKIRPNILEMVETMTAPKDPVATIVHNFYGKGAMVMTDDHSVNIGDNATFKGTTLVAQTITDSFKTIERSPASPAVKQQLRELHNQVGALATKLTEHERPAEAEEVAQKFAAFTQAATAAKPDRTWYQKAGDDLIVAAKAAAEYGLPIAALVTKIVALL